MRNLLITLLFLISNISFCQISAVVIDSKTKESIPYVNIWVENENNGTSSDDNGNFSLSVNGIKKIVFSAIGYETKKVLSNLIKGNIELNQISTVLDEVVIYTKKKSRELVLGKFDESKIKNFITSRLNPIIIARHFNYKKKYEKTPFLKSIEVLTLSNKKNAIFNVRLYHLNENSEPGEYVFNENIIAKSKKRTKRVQIDLSKFDIMFPEKGFFIALEWLIIEKNAHKFEIKNKKYKIYNPNFGIVLKKTNEDSWIYEKGKWNRVNHTQNLNGQTTELYELLAVELTLTN
jgi:hypothetical protein